MNARTLLILPATVAWLVVVGAAGQDIPATAALEYSFTISASPAWTDTGMDLAAGDTLAFTSESKSSAKGCSPDGNPSAASVGPLPLESAAEGALLARTSEASAPILIGKSKELKADSSGHLFLKSNVNSESDCVFSVKLKIAHAAQAPAKAAPRNVKDQLSAAARVWAQGQFGTASASSSGAGTIAVAGAASSGNATLPNADTGLKLTTLILDSGLKKHLDELPRRVHDHAGNLGDMVNFVIVGSEDEVKTALDASDWHLADVDSKEAGLKVILNTYQKKDYVEMPMSHLYLFDRMQDFGYEQAEAYSVVASRHHFRLWKAPFTWNNTTVWVGAGTHDIGFEKDIRTGKLTHKIDPAVDSERENIAQGLERSGKTKGLTYYLPPDPVQEAKNASGGSYHSDGQVLVVLLK